jgi:hypothetical protein
VALEVKKVGEIAAAVLMVEPSTFGFDEQTAETNSFQMNVQLSPSEIGALVRAEFHACVESLRAEGVEVVVHDFEDGVPRPNAVFPNNWLSTWPDGRVYLYPMATASRRAERDDVVIDRLKRDFRVSEVVDITSTEQQGRFLESTGVMVFDHAAKEVYACISKRCDEELFTEHARMLGYKPRAFHADDKNGSAVYHTNIMLAVQQSTAVVCLDTIKNLRERAQIQRSLENSGHVLVDISYAQMAAYCANVIQLRAKDGSKVLLMSQSAHDAFTPEQVSVLSQDNKLVVAAVPTIEAVGGGSVRCMVAEIFLPLRVPAGV